eukprot:757794-Hanusia_phi.AAC.1
MATMSLFRTGQVQQIVRQDQGGDNYAIHFNLGLAYFFLRQWDKVSRDQLFCSPDRPSHPQLSVSRLLLKIARAQPELLSHVRSCCPVRLFLTSALKATTGSAMSTRQTESTTRLSRISSRWGVTVQLDPLAADTYFNIGTVYQQMKQHENAVHQSPVLRLVVLTFAPSLTQSSPDSPASLAARCYHDSNLGVSLKALGLVNEAIGSCSCPVLLSSDSESDSYYKAVAKNPLPQAFGNLASALHEIGERT